MIGRCQRCGRACEDPLCPACQAFVAALQRLLKKYPAADPQHRRPSRQAGPPAVVVETFKAVGSLQLHRLSRRARFYCVTCMEYKRGDRVATTRGDWKQAVCDRCYAALVKKPQGKAKTKAPKRMRQPSKTVRHEQLKWRNGPTAESATAKGQSKRKGKKGEKARGRSSSTHHHGTFTEYRAPRVSRWSPRVFGRNRPPSDLG